MLNRCVVSQVYVMWGSSVEGIWWGKWFVVMLAEVVYPRDKCGYELLKIVCGGVYGDLTLPFIMPLWRFI